MASLKQVTTVTRHLLVIGTLSIVGIIVLLSLINFVKSLHPTPPPPPTVSFGKLPTISFPQRQIDPTKFTYSLETLSGDLPSFSDRVSVYDIEQPQPNLVALSTISNILSKAGFTGTPQQISQSVYKWTNTDTLPKTISADIVTDNFSLTSDFLTNQDVLQSNNIPDQNGAISLATTFLQNLSLFPGDIDTSKTKATLLSISNGQLVPATSLSSTQVIRVDFFQSDVNRLPIFYPNATYSTMYLFTAGGTSQGQVVAGHFVHQQLGTNQATYPIITAQQAFDELKKGNAYISSYDGTASTITIRNVVLGYYLGNTQQQYLMPIIIFEGDNGFYAYVPALTHAWIQK